MIPGSSSALTPYIDSLDAAAEWLDRSIQHGRGGSCAYYVPLLGWSKPYPETTGYLIPTLLRIPRWVRNSERIRSRAEPLGHWLLEIQHPEGWWAGGLHPPKRLEPSVFNTAQIVLGLTSLHEETGDDEWLRAARRAGEWLVRTAEPGGIWRTGAYVEGFQPSYYTRVAWPLLELDLALGGDSSFGDVAREVLDRHGSDTRPDGMIAGWGFEPGEPAFTHTIAYTIRGFIEAGRLDGSPRYDSIVDRAIDTLFRKSELSGGRLPGAYGNGWNATMQAICLTGNCQIAICLLRWHRRRADLRLVNAAAKLLDVVISRQKLRHPLAGVRGGVAGSSPVWGQYLRWRYPNWAAKFLVDAIVDLLAVLEEEGLELS